MGYRCFPQCLHEKAYINPTLRNFTEKYTQCKAPDESTVRKNYNFTIENIRDKIQDNFMWVSIDETQDCEGRYSRIP
jgi:hypothetical protein